MERRAWLALVYREACRFVEQHRETLEKVETEAGAAAAEKLAELQSDLEEQLKPALIAQKHLEDLIKYSLLRDPPAELWQNERSWEGVLISVAEVCLRHDVLGLAGKIVRGELPQMDHEGTTSAEAPPESRGRHPHGTP